LAVQPGRAGWSWISSWRAMIGLIGEPPWRIWRMPSTHSSKRSS